MLELPGSTDEFSGTELSRAIWVLVDQDKIGFGPNRVLVPKERNVI